MKNPSQRLKALSLMGRLKEEDAARIRRELVELQTAAETITARIAFLRGRLAEEGQASSVEGSFYVSIGSQS